MALFPADMAGFDSNPSVPSHVLFNPELNLLAEPAFDLRSTQGNVADTYAHAASDHLELDDLTQDAVIGIRAVHNEAAPLWLDDSLRILRVRDLPEVVSGTTLSSAVAGRVLHLGATYTTDGSTVTVTNLRIHLARDGATGRLNCATDQLAAVGRFTLSAYALLA